MFVQKRPTKRKATRAVERFLRARGAKYIPYFDIVHDGEDAWSFWILETDTTSYVHQDLTIEWYGTNWRSEDEQDTEA